MSDEHNTARTESSIAEFEPVCWGTEVLREVLVGAAGQGLRATAGSLEIGGGYRRRP